MASPSRQDGVAYEIELVMTNSAVAQLMQIGTKREFKKQITATACVLFHRFFSRRSFKRFDRLEVSLACLVLAGKMVEFTPPAILFKALVAERLARQGHTKPVPDDSELWKTTKEALVALERHVLSAIEFDVGVDLPFHHVDALCVSMGLTPADHPLRELALKFLNDLLKTTLVLQYRPRELAAAALWFARLQLEKMHSAGRGPPVAVPPQWATVLPPVESAQAITNQFTEVTLIIRREAEKHQAAAAAHAAAAGQGGAVHA